MSHTKLVVKILLSPEKLEWLEWLEWLEQIVLSNLSLLIVLSWGEIG